MRAVLAAVLAMLIVLLHGSARADDLQSWNEGPAKAAILDLVTDVMSVGWTVVSMKNDWREVFPSP